MVGVSDNDKCVSLTLVSVCMSGWVCVFVSFQFLSFKLSSGPDPDVQVCEILEEVMCNTLSVSVGHWNDVATLCMSNDLTCCSQATVLLGLHPLHCSCCEVKTVTLSPFGLWVCPITLFLSCCVWVFFSFRVFLLSITDWSWSDVLILYCSSQFLWKEESHVTRSGTQHHSSSSVCPWLHGRNIVSYCLGHSWNSEQILTKLFIMKR